MQLLEKQRVLAEVYNQLPLIRERIELPQVLSVPKFKEYTEKARKIH